MWEASCVSVHRCIYGCGTSILTKTLKVYAYQMEMNKEKILRKIDKCGLELTEWSKRKFGNVRKELETKRKQLAKAERYARRGGDTSWLRTLEAEINSLMDKEAKMWRQRSREAWLKDGDKNTRFFHTKATQRR